MFPHALELAQVLDKLRQEGYLPYVLLTNPGSNEAPIHTGLERGHSAILSSYLAKMAAGGQDEWHRPEAGIALWCGEVLPGTEVLRDTR